MKSTKKTVIDKLTKLITTVGPTSESEENLRLLFLSGSTCVRLNFSHGDENEHRGRAITTRKLINELKMPISILLDTKGPEIRTGDFKKGFVKIERNSEIIIDCFNTMIGDETKFYVDYKHLIKDVKVGSLILLDDGKLQLQVTCIKSKLIYVKALNTHIIKNHRGVNLPGTILSLPFLSEKDKKDIKFACTENLDYIALSFVRNRQDILDVKSFIKDFPRSKNLKLISKIESQQAIDCFDEILDESDMIMIARGDLGIEIPYEIVPYYQEKIIAKCIKVGKPVIVATQMLDSMVKNPAPTRAEVSDVYFSVTLGTSSTMLSGESANGDYPILATHVMANIAKKAEEEIYNKSDFKYLKSIVKSSGIKKIIDAVENKKYNTLISINPKYEDISKVASLHLPLQIVVITNDWDLYTKFGVHFGVKTIFETNTDSLDKTKIKNLLFEKPYVNSHLNKMAYLTDNFVIKPFN